MPCRTETEEMCFLQAGMELVRVLKSQGANRGPESGGVPKRGNPDSHSQTQLRDRPELGTKCRILIAALPADIDGQQQVVDR